MVYDISKPMDMVFNSVDDLREIAELTTRPYTDIQMVGLGYMVLARQPFFAVTFGVDFAATQPTKHEPIFRRSSQTHTRN